MMIHRPIWLPRAEAAVLAQQAQRVIACLDRALLTSAKPTPPKEPTAEPRLRYSLKEAARLLSKHRRTLERRIAREHIPVIRDGRSVYLDHDTLVAISARGGDQA